MGYVVESFTAAEISVLERFFTNVDKPVFALINLPEVVKGALFARYSRTSKSLRRLFLDEFYGDLIDGRGDISPSSVGVTRAEELYAKVFLEFGDDSVAQLGGVHLACEQASNLLTKILEWGRLMSYLEQSTRYIPYDLPWPGGGYRYYRDPEVMSSSLGGMYESSLDEIMSIYKNLLERLVPWLQLRSPRQPGDSDFVWKQAIRAKAFDALRGILPAAAQSNLGIYGTGQSYEHLIMRMRASALPEARKYADMMLVELRKVIPSFLTRVDREDRGMVWSAYFESTRLQTQALANRLLGDVKSQLTDEVTLVDWDPEGENKLVAAVLWSYTALDESQVVAYVAQMSDEEKTEVINTYVGDRTNRRHKGGRGLERTGYRFQVLSDYGAFRDLQRHRMCTIEWQQLTARLGYDVPSIILEAGMEAEYCRAMELGRQLSEALFAAGFVEQGSYAVNLAYKLRYVMTFNAREATHILELRTAPQGHESYRRICQTMHRLIRDVAGHRVIAGTMRFVDHSDAVELGRLAAERTTADKRSGRSPSDEDASAS